MSNDRKTEEAEGGYIEKPDSTCKHCGYRIFWWPSSQFWSHGSGPNMGKINCEGIHAPYLDIWNPGPFAEPIKEQP